MAGMGVLRQEPGLCSAAWTSNGNGVQPFTHLHAFLPREQVEAAWMPKNLKPQETESRFCAAWRRARVPEGSPLPSCCKVGAGLLPDPSVLAGASPELRRQHQVLLFRQKECLLTISSSPRGAQEENKHISRHYDRIRMEPSYFNNSAASSPMEG